MTTKNTKRPPSGAPAVKLLIAATSVSALLGGWVAFASQPITATTNPPAQPLEVNLGLAPIPTVLPRPTVQQNHIQSGSQPGSQPVNSQTSLPALRTVNVPPPAPVTTTQSSR